MKNKAAGILVTLLFVAVAARVGAREHELLVEFEGATGVDPVGSFAGTANANGAFPDVVQNIVRGVSPAGSAWRIGDLRAAVDADGRITVRASGLVLAGGNRIGQSLQLRVGATLICEATAPFVQRSTDNLVTLDLNGDFRIDDTLSPVPSECLSPVLLIRANGNGAWLAAAIAKPGRF